MTTEKEKKDKIVGALVSAGIHGAVILLFVFILAWKQPFPPKPEYGIELNIGLEQEGSGMEQPENVNPAASEPVREEQTAEEQVPEQVPEEIPTEPQEEVVPVPEDVTEQPEEDIPDSRQEESPTEAAPETKENVQEPEKEIIPEKKTQQDDKKPDVGEAPSGQVKSPPVEKPEEKPTINEQAIYPAKKGGNQGETKNAVGDAGKPEGTIEAQAIYGKQGGGGGGPRLELSGWKWDFEPNPKDTSKESGKIIFDIEVDKNGEVRGIEVHESNVNPEVLQIYRKEVERLTFSPTNSNSARKPATGKIIFIIRAK